MNLKTHQRINTKKMKSSSTFNFVSPENGGWLESNTHMLENGSHQLESHSHVLENDSHQLKSHPHITGGKIMYPCGRNL